MNQFIYGLTWGLGFFCAFGILLMAFLIVLAGLVGISNIGKAVTKPPMPPGQ